MAGDIYVTFGGDTAALEASLASAKASVNSFARELAALSREQIATGASADSELGQKMLAVAAQLTQAKGAVSGLKGELGELGKGGGEGAGGLASLLAPITAIRESLGGVVELFAAAFAVDKVVEFVKSMGELGEQTERTSQILGLTTEQVGELQYAFAATGTSSENLDQMIGRFEVSLAKAGAGTGPAAAGLKALGLSAQELIGIPFPEQMDKIANAVSRFADGPAKAAALQSLGRGFVELIPLLNQGAAGFDALREKADATNSVLDEGVTKSLVGMQHSFVDLGASIKGLAIQSFAPFIDVVRNAVEMASGIAQAFSTAEKQGGALAQALTLIADGLKVGLSLYAAQIGVLEQLWATGNMAFNILDDATRGFGEVIREVFVALGAALPAFWKGLVNAGETAFRAVEKQALDFGAVLDDTLHLDFAGAKAAFGQMGDDASAALKQIGAGFNGVFDFSKAEAAAKATSATIAQDVKIGGDQMLADAQSTVDRLKSIWGLGADASKNARHGEGEGNPGDYAKPQVPALDELTAAKNKAAQQQIQAAEAEAALEVDAYKHAATEKEQLLDEQLKTHQISMSQWLTQTVDALDDEAQDVKATYDSELRIAGLTSAKKLEIAKQEADALAAIQHQIVAAEVKAAEESAAQWKSYADTVAGLIDGQVNGLLRGTETMRQAVKNMAASGIEDVIKFCIKWAAEHAATVLANIAGINTLTAAQVAGSSAQAAAQQSAASAGALAGLGNILHSIMASAAQTFAGVTGFMAPLIGPAAPAAGAAAEATVLSVAGGLYDSGAWSLPRDMLIGAHKGEMVIPQRGGIADEFRSFMAAGGFSGGARAGGGDVHIHPTQVHNHQSLDATGAYQAFRDKSSEMAKAFNEAVRHGAHLGLRRLANA